MRSFSRSVVVLAVSMASVIACTKSSGRGDKLASTGTTEALAQDDTALYWLAFDRPASKLSVQAYAKKGGARREVVSVPAAHEWMSDTLAVDDKNAYFFARAAKDETLWSAPKTGGPPVALAGGQRNSQGAIASDGAHVYWVADGEIRAVPLAGGSPVVLATGQAGARDLMADGSGVYWDHGGDVSRVATSGTGGPEKVAQVGGKILHMVDDASSLYFATMGSQDNPATLCRVAKSGGKVTVMWTAPSIGVIAVDGAAIYFDYRAPISAWVNKVRIGKLPLEGGALAVLDELGEEESLHEMSVDADKLYVLVSLGTTDVLKALPKGK